jgi:ribosomal protein L5
VYLEEESPLVPYLLNLSRVNRQPQIRTILGLGWEVFQQRGNSTIGIPPTRKMVKQQEQPQLSITSVYVGEEQDITYAESKDLIHRFKNL